MNAAPDRQVFKAAASWYVQFQAESPSAAERQAWQRWIDSDPTHQMAWNQVEQVQRSLGAMPRDLTRRALNQTQQRRQVLKLMLLLAGSGYLGWNVKQHTPVGNYWADYRTRVGQRQHIELDDGTQLELNTDTALDVRFDPQQRLIHLRAGEILLRTGKRVDNRPFYVQTAEGRVQALGTVFSVRQLAGSTRVGVVEDRVSLQPRDALGSARELTAGEAADFDNQQIGAKRAYRGAETAWVDGQLIVLNARLDEVLAEIDRYRPGTLHCDAQAAKLRVSGTFRVDASDAVLANLQASLPIKVSYFSRYWVSIKHLG